MATRVKVQSGANGCKETIISVEWRLEGINVEGKEDGKRRERPTNKGTTGR